MKDESFEFTPEMVARACCPMCGFRLWMHDTYAKQCAREAKERKMFLIGTSVIRKSKPE